MDVDFLCIVSQCYCKAFRTEAWCKETNSFDNICRTKTYISFGLSAVPSSTYRIDEMETALLGLESIDACEVSRTAAGSAEQHVWAVTFLEAS